MDFPLVLKFGVLVWIFFTRSLSCLFGSIQHQFSCCFPTSYNMDSIISLSFRSAFRNLSLRDTLQIAKVTPLAGLRYFLTRQFIRFAIKQNWYKG